MEKVKITIEVTYTGDAPDHSALLDAIQESVKHLELDPYGENSFDEEGVSESVCIQEG